MSCLSLFLTIPGDASVSAGKPTFSINLSGSVQVARHCSFELPNNTILGYSCYEVTFDTVEGSFELVVPDTTDPGKVEGSRKHHMFDEPDGQRGKVWAFYTLTVTSFNDVK